MDHRRDAESAEDAQKALQTLRDEIATGTAQLESGQCAPWDVEKVKQRIRQLMIERQSRNQDSK